MEFLIGTKGRQARKPIAREADKLCHKENVTWHGTKTQYAAFAAARA